MAKGVRWTYEIHFHNYDEDNRVSPSIFTDLRDFFPNKFGLILDPNQTIRTIYAYKTPLSKWQLTSFTIYHLFIVLETDQGWWSIEKDGESIIIRRSNWKSTIITENKRGSRGLRVSFVKEATGKKSIGNLLHWLCFECEVFDSYHFLFSNCKAFSKRVFDYVADNEELCWYDGAFS
ncbi:unnamed protein product [Mytilus coruscus]|uniref:Uncharacterized protein n=1 Tax=Mytilus coruscus TaxID=42192 RepID=A0A6J8D786_MYTCO|nr:unnamed protein product [Mytilus coruscus]